MFWIEPPLDNSENVPYTFSSPWTGAYFAQRMYIQDPRETYKKMTEEALSELQTLDKSPGIAYGPDPETGHRYHIDAFVSKMRERMRNPTKAKEEDDKNLKKIRDKMDVTWGAQSLSAPEEGGFLKNAGILQLAKMGPFWVFPVTIL